MIIRSLRPYFCLCLWINYLNLSSRFFMQRTSMHLSAQKKTSVPMTDGCVCVGWIDLSDETKFNGVQMKCDWAGRLLFHHSMHFYGTKNAIQPMGEKSIDEKHQKEECRSELISCMCYCNHTNSRFNDT